MLSLPFQHFHNSIDLLHKTKQFHNFDHYQLSQTVPTKLVKNQLEPLITHGECNILKPHEVKNLLFMCQQRSMKMKMFQFAVSTAF